MKNIHQTLKTVLIIGSKGFIGNHLVSYLQEKELKVWGADVVVDYTEKTINMIISELNNSHRYLLGYKTLNEVFLTSLNLNVALINSI